MKYFGTDGFRGRVNDVLRLEHAIKIGEYLGHHFKGLNPVPPGEVGNCLVVVFLGPFWAA